MFARGTHSSQTALSAARNLRTSQPLELPWQASEAQRFNSALGARICLMGAFGCSPIPSRTEGRLARWVCWAHGPIKLELGP
eukprot:6384969-Alexandrium_andersonii.AAC.1